MSDVELLLKDYRLATAEILYRLPDYHTVLQSYIWQDYDIAPQYPVLKKFLDFWEAELDGPLHSVTITSSRLLKPAEFRYAAHHFTLH